MGSGGWQGRHERLRVGSPGGSYVFSLSQGAQQKPQEQGVGVSSAEVSGKAKGQEPTKDKPTDRDSANRPNRKQSSWLVNLTPCPLQAPVTSRLSPEPTPYLLSGLAPAVAGRIGAE